MQVGDLVRLTRVGWENIVGVIVERYSDSHASRLAKARVLWGTTGKTGTYYIENLEVLGESR